MKNVGLRQLVIQNWDHLDIKTISARPVGGLNCEVPLYVHTIVVDSFSIIVSIFFTFSSTLMSTYLNISICVTSLSISGLVFQLPASYLFSTDIRVNDSQPYQSSGLKNSILKICNTLPESKSSTSQMCSPVIKLVIADSAPLAILLDLHKTFRLRISSYQSYVISCG